MFISTPQRNGIYTINTGTPEKLGHWEMECLWQRCRVMQPTEFFDLQFTTEGKRAMKLKKNIFTDLSKSSAEFPKLY